jgi:hypothetical protein
MKTILGRAAVGLLLLMVPPGPLQALEPACDPALAVVRIKSHGASGSIIATTEGRSWILSCCHMFFGSADRVDQALLSKRLVIDGPDQPYAPPKRSTARVIAVDPVADLSLIEIDNGPFNYIPVAAAGFSPGRNLSSAGYDLMKWPITTRRATIVAQSNNWTFTQERPVQGRSGGGLFDLDARALIGVVNGYEVNGQQRGIYVAHAAIVKFLNKSRERMQQAQKQRLTPLMCPT